MSLQFFFHPDFQCPILLVLLGDVVERCPRDAHGTRHGGHVSFLAQCFFWVWDSLIVSSPITSNNSLFCFWMRLNSLHEGEPCAPFPQPSVDGLFRNGNN